MTYKTFIAVFFLLSVTLLLPPSVLAKSEDDEKEKTKRSEIETEENLFSFISLPIMQAFIAGTATTPYSSSATNTAAISISIKREGPASSASSTAASSTHATSSSDENPSLEPSPFERIRERIISGISPENSTSSATTSATTSAASVGAILPPVHTRSGTVGNPYAFNSPLSGEETLLLSLLSIVLGSLGFLLAQKTALQSLFPGDRKGRAVLAEDKSSFVWEHERSGM